MRVNDILSCELLCLDAPHGKPRHHHREYHGVSPQIIGRKWHSRGHRALHDFHDFLQAILSVLCFVEYLPNLHMNLTLGNLRTGGRSIHGPEEARCFLLPARAVPFEVDSRQFFLGLPIANCDQVGCFLVVFQDPIQPLEYIRMGMLASLYVRRVCP